LTKKLGQPPKHWAEMARVWALYEDVIKTTGLDDATLDKQYALSDAVRMDGIKDLPRPRAFEGMRKSASKAREGRYYCRSMSEIVAALDRNPDLKGIEEFYNAEMWDVFQEDNPRDKYVDARIARLLDTHSLEVVDPLEHQSTIDMGHKYGNEALFKRSLELSTNGMHLVHQITLVWSLYQISTSSFNMDISPLLVAKADALLDKFFMSIFQYDRGLHFYASSIEALRRTHLNLSSGDGQTRKCFFPNLWIVLPKGIASQLTEKHLTDI
jgi:hypothetical protein